LAVKRLGKFWFGVAVVAVFFASFVLSACPSKNDGAVRASKNDFIVDLDKPVPKKAEAPAGPPRFPTPEELFKQKCGQCHEPERGLNKYKGEDWKPVIERMMAKPSAFINASVARTIYFYLYEKTTGKKSPEEEEQKDAPVSSAQREAYGKD